MSNEPTSPRAELIIPSTDLPADMAFFTNLGFRLDQILTCGQPDRLPGSPDTACVFVSTVMLFASPRPFGFAINPRARRTSSPPPGAQRCEGRFW